MRHGMPSIAKVEREFSTGPPRRVVVEARDLRAWDSSLLLLVAGIDELCKDRGIPTQRSGLPEGLTRLVDYSETVAEKKDEHAAEEPSGFSELVGIEVIKLYQSAGEFLDFLGAVTASFANLLRRNARYRTSDLLEVVQQCGANALGIVTLISYLVG